MLEVHGLSKSFDGRAVNRDVSFRAEKGEIVVVVGPNASGKTTLLKSIAGLVEPDHGVILVNGDLVYEKKPGMRKARVNKPPYERNIGFVPTEHSLYPHLTLRGNLELPLRKRGWSRGDIDRRIRELLEVMGLEEYGDMYPGQLSNGLKQKASIARALSYNPPLLLLDEPFSAIDPVTREKLREEFLGLFRKLGVTVVMTTHLLEDIVFFRDHVLALVNGRVVYNGELVEERIVSSPYMLEMMGFISIPVTVKKCIGVDEAVVAAGSGEIKVRFNPRGSICSDGGKALLVVNPGFLGIEPPVNGDAPVLLEAVLNSVVDELTGLKLDVEIEGKATRLPINESEWMRIQGVVKDGKIPLYVSSEHVYLVSREGEHGAG
ncbi:ATP-binding cassette domain-containing protein [Desulfurococcus mucosus]|uniref:Molybdate/tungstate import ATP-binding protein WtpC n=1 Tax=Desulfurococcus mucosus (strain ATCC 35584 / DSM 2162 / JCM 9187 / O7/1) TaxID=765177 RepID=E8R9U7_DESM0|nr:ATP-binding cassette domain-containing protein [Desulfurococcus mucosus]ADV65273.1 ABC transporter related protein [Desulfurococcus mucosus DSM 2162]